MQVHLFSVPACPHSLEPHETWTGSVLCTTASQDLAME